MVFVLLLAVAFLAVPPVSANEGVGYTVRTSVSDDPVTTPGLSDTRPGRDQQAPILCRE
ncbi:MAG: hypothetical protein WBH88_09270 [Candidatus Methanoculleus thermohydrogenotrophicum]